MARRFMEIAAVETPPESVEADLLVLPIVDPPRLGGPGARLDGILGGRLEHLIEDREIKGGVGQLALTHTLGELGAHRLAVAGVGKPAGLVGDSLRTAAARAAQRAIGLRGGTLAWVLDPDLPLAPADQARAIVDGTILGSFDAGAWKTDDEERHSIDRLLICGDDAAGQDEAARRAGVVAEWANRCRELVNAPANELTPTVLVERAEALVSGLSSLSFDSIGRDEIEAAGMGAFVAVARGSDHEARLITVEYAPPGAPEGLVLGLVGKAITFDTGGISIKPAARMENMKSDMAGGAAALCGLGAIAELGLPVRAVAVVPATENMPGGHSSRPGDIVTALNGKTIEITNTDAEGRLVLADALVHARRRGATHVVDLATLTGAVVIALGDYYAGVMGSDDAFVSDVLAAAAASGDHAWRLPIHDTYKRLFRSTFADMKNSSDLRQAGPVYAARFLQEFAGDGPWAHLDIAGTAYLDRSRGDYYTGMGATGYGVRLIAELAQRLAGDPGDVEAPPAG
jgi:leucyl aminopeptidase